MTVVKMKNISPQTKSFIILFVLALFGVYASLMLWGDLSYMEYQRRMFYEQLALNNPGLPIHAAKPGMDISSWPVYTDSSHNFSFSYMPGWKILPITKKDGYDLLQIDPGKKFYNIQIYISTKNFYPVDSSNSAVDKIKAGKWYYTFYLTKSLSLVPDFNALVYSTNFGS